MFCICYSFINSHTNSKSSVCAALPLWHIPYTLLAGSRTNTFCCREQNYNTSTGIGPFNQNLSHLVVFRSWHLHQSLLHLKYLYSFGLASVLLDRNVINTPTCSLWISGYFPAGTLRHLGCWVQQQAALMCPWLHVWRHLTVWNWRTQTNSLAPARPESFWWKPG